MNHEIKAEPALYSRVADGSKNFWVSDNEFIQKGDVVEIREYDPRKRQPTDSMAVGFTESPTLTFQVGYVEVLSSGRFVISLLPTKASPEKSRKSKRA